MNEQRREPEAAERREGLGGDVDVDGLGGAAAALPGPLSNLSTVGERRTGHPRRDRECRSCVERRAEVFKTSFEREDISMPFLFLRFLVFFLEF